MSESLRKYPLRERKPRWANYGAFGFMYGQWRVVKLASGKWSAYATRPGYHEAGSINTSEHDTAKDAMQHVEAVIRNGR